MNQDCKRNLQSTCNLLVKLTDKDFNQPIKALSNASIAQHVCRIIEYYECYVEGMRKNCINYDARKSCTSIENDRLYCIKKINTLCLELKDNLIQQKGIIIKYNTSHVDRASSELVSNSLRELMFCLEHSIHEQAMIKLALCELGKLNLVDENFGLTSLAIRNKKNSIELTNI